MKFPHLLYLSGVLLFLAMIAPANSSAANQTKTFKQHFIWSNDSGTQQIQALLLKDRNSRGSVTRILFELDSEERFILEKVVEASSGEVRLRLEHDSSSWWLEYSLSIGSSYETMTEFLHNSLNVPHPDAHATFSLKARDFRYDRSYDYQPEEGQEIAELFESSAINDERCIEYARDIPERMRRAIFLLSRFDRKVKIYYGDFVDLLIHLLEGAGFDSNLGQEELVFERVGYEWGLGTMVTPEELEFTSRFESIDNADPLAGFRPEELFPEE